MFLSHHPTFFRPSVHTVYGCRRPQLYVYRVTSDEEEESSKKTTNHKTEKPAQITPTTSIRASPEPKPEENHDSTATPSVVYLNRSARLIDEEAAFTLQVDLPGVKRDSVTVEVDDETIQIKAERKHASTTTPQTFHQQFSIDTSRVRVSEIKAGLTDGVLSVHIPKKSQPSVEPFSLQVTRGYVPEVELVAGKNFTYSLDLPGIRKEDVSIEYLPEKLVVTGERKQGGGAALSSKTVRAINVDPRKLDVTKTKAYLADGVLQILVPLKDVVSSRKIAVSSDPLLIETENQSTKPSVLATDIETSEQPKKKLKSSESTSKSDACSTRSDEVSVETVNEKDEDDEEISPKKRKVE